MLARLAIIIVLGFLSYGAMLPTPFRVMDDRISIVENPVIKSTKNIPGIFKEGYFHDKSYYRPLINLSFLGEYHFFGLNSFFYNLDNLILHIFNALLVCLLVSRMLNDDTMGFWAGLLFVMHPIQWEAVCNVPGRSILMSAFFDLSSFVLFLEWYRQGRAWLSGVILLTFFLGLLCKESTGVLPLVIAGYLWTDKKKDWLNKAVYFGPFIGGIIGYVLLRQFFGITDVHQTSKPDVLVLGFVTFLRSVITDLRMLILPVDLHYDRCLPFFLSFSNPQAWGTCLCWMAVAALLFLNRRKIDPFVLFLIAWFAIELFPVSQLVASIGVGAGHISTAEHFLYIACIPVFTGALMAFRWAYTLQLMSRSLMKFLGGAFLVFFFLTAVGQSIYASNEFAMLNRSLEYEPHNPRVQSSMGLLSIFRNDIPDAQKHFRMAVDAEPTNPTYHIALGTALSQQGKWIEGLEQYVVFDPGKDQALVDREEKLTMAYIDKQLADGKKFDARGWLAIGIYKAKTNQTEGALDAFHKTVSLNPDQPDAWFNLASIYEATHQENLARDAYRKVLSVPQASFFQRDFALHHLKSMEQR